MLETCLTAEPRLGVFSFHEAAGRSQWEPARSGQSRQGHQIRRPAQFHDQQGVGDVEKATTAEQLATYHRFMSDANSKKAGERRLLELFLERAGISATIAEEREAPDFVLNVESRLVGVEVTELHYNDGGPITLKAAESISDGVVAEAWRLYKVLGGKPVHVSFLFSNGAELKRMRRDQAARTLAEFMLALDPPLDNLLDLRPFGSDPFPAVDELVGLHILAVDEWPKAIWHALKGGWVASLEDLRLQAEVDAKAPKIDIYRNVASEVWLVIATLGRGPSQFFHIPNGTTRLGATVRSPFDRTFYLSGFEGRVYEIG